MGRVDLMLRTPLHLAYIKRHLRILYGWTQATPKHEYLDPLWDKSVDIYPGMVMQRSAGGTVTLLNATGVPMGLSGFLLAPQLGIDEITEQGINAVAVWVLSPDAEAEILAPAFDAAASWVVPSDGTVALVHAYTTGAKRGQLCPTGATGASVKPVARLIKIISTQKIIVGGLYGTE